MPNSVIYQTLFPIKNSFDTDRLGLGQTLVQNGKKRPQTRRSVTTGPNVEKMYWKKKTAVINF